MIFNKNIFKVMGKMLLGIVSTIVIEVIFIIGLYRLVPGPGYVDPLPFLFKYPIITASLIGVYFGICKKQYAFTVGLALGFVIFMLIMTFLFEVLAGLASL